MTKPKEAVSDRQDASPMLDGAAGDRDRAALESLRLIDAFRRIACPAARQRLILSAEREAQRYAAAGTLH